MIRHLVLLGLGPGHLRLLAYLAQQARSSHADIAISLLTRQQRHISDAALLKTVGSSAQPGTHRAADRLARQAEADRAQLETVVQKSGVRWLEHSAQAINPVGKTLLLDDGRELRFDWLSVEPEPQHNRDLVEHLLPGARANGLFLRPREAFCKLWPQVQQLASQRPLRFAVVLNQAAAASAQATAHWAHEKFALELAFALRHAFKGSAVSVITGGPAVGEALRPALQHCLQAALKRRQITVLREAATTVQPGEVVLQSGARLACDVPLLAMRPETSRLWGSSGMALDALGQALTDAALRSTSHPHIFVNEQRQMDDAQRLFRSLRCLIKGQPPLAAKASLRAVTSASPVPGAILAGLQRINCADGRAIVAWKNWAVESRQL